jgi:hypothetical protein
VIFRCLALCVTTVLGAGGAPVAAKAQATLRSPLQPAAILTVISGVVELRERAGAFAPAADGAVVYVGSTVRTSAESRAVLTLFEGSTVELEPASDITIEEATTRGDATIVDLAQSLGRSWHVVTHLTTPDSRYEVRTPSATASVRGTSFEVAVADDASGPTTTVTTTEGLVATSDAAALSTVLVAPDQVTTVRANGVPEAPRPAPEPARVVTVNTGAPAALVVDPVGRANGIKDGRVVAQTPGARVAMVDGSVVVSLPNVPDGVLTTTVVSDRAVSVDTTVMERGRDVARARRELRTGMASTTTGVDLRTGRDGATELRALTAEETERAPDAKVRSKDDQRGAPKAKDGSSSLDTDGSRVGPARAAATPKPTRR